MLCLCFELSAVEKTESRLREDGGLGGGRDESTLPAFWECVLSETLMSGAFKEVFCCRGRSRLSDDPSFSETLHSKVVGEAALLIVSGESARFIVDGESARFIVDGESARFIVGGDRFTDSGDDAQGSVKGDGDTLFVELRVSLSVRTVFCFFFNLTAFRVFFLSET